MHTSSEEALLAQHRRGFDPSYGVTQTMSTASMDADLLRGQPVLLSPEARGTPPAHQNIIKSWQQAATAAKRARAGSCARSGDGEEND